ncbi:hypothetical protein [Nocardia sp. CC201C]|uniref:hypothetical protein n=1 Tax=Nocardia sp. CC201C TaxID=3044575 RepID=UPI0024A859DF|nr:hypothetical protein [Nocardia sp. CC201C]
MQSNAIEIAKILTAAEGLMRAAITTAATDPERTAQTIQSAIGTMQSVRGFLL